MKELRPALVLLALFTVLCGVLYPLAVTGAARFVPARAAASQIGQTFTEPRYFWGRPSAVGYDAKTSSGTNQGPLSPALREAVAARVQTLRDADPGNDAPIPVDLVTSSGSGLDPDISPAAAYYQVPRVARARGLDEARVKALVDAHVVGPQLGIFGESRVNVVRLNVALDALESKEP